MTDLVILNQLGAGASALIRAHAPDARVVEIGTSPSLADVDGSGATVLLAIPQHELTPEQRASRVEWATDIEWVHLPSAGADPYPPALLQGRVVTCARGLMSVPIAEHVLATMLAFERGLPEVWAPGLKAADVAPLGVLDGRTLGIVGLGSIGGCHRHAGARVRHARCRREPVRPVLVDRRCGRRPARGGARPV